MKVNFCLTILLCTPLWSSAQDFGAISQNNLSGIYATLTNPANAVGGIDRVSFNLIGVSVGINNNTLRSDIDYDLLRIKSKQPFMIELGSLDRMSFGAPRKWVRKPVIYAEVDALQLAAQFAISKKVSIYGFARERAVANFDKGDYFSLKFLVDEGYNHTEQIIQLGFDARSMSYQELGIGAAVQLYEKRQHYIKAGFTYKRINARGVYAVNIPRFESRLVDSTIQINGELSILKTALDVAVQNPLDFILNPAMGSGHAMDIGFVYEHRPRSLKSTYRKNNMKKRNKTFNGRNLTKYDYRIGVSLNDLGRVNFNRDAVLTSTNIVSAVFSPRDLATMNSEDYSKQLLDSSELVTSSESISFKLPTTLILSYDQRLLNNWFASITYHQNMVSKGLTSFYQPTQVQAQIRKETEKCAFGFPVNIIPSTRTFTVGAYAQMGPFFIGTANLGTLFLKKMYNPSFYTGLFYNIRYKADDTIENHSSFRTKRRQAHSWSGM